MNYEHAYEVHVDSMDYQQVNIHVTRTTEVCCIVPILTMKEFQSLSTAKPSYSLLLNKLTVKYSEKLPILQTPRYRRILIPNSNPKQTSTCQPSVVMIGLKEGTF